MNSVVENKQQLLSGSDMLIETLRMEKVETIFGYPGGAVLPIYDSLYKSQDIRHILTRHEQAAIHAADGYARVTGRPGVAIVTSGPGATNAVTGIANAYMDSIPLVVFTGQVPTEMIGRDSFQEVDIFGMTMAITKHNYLVMDIEDLPRVIKEAFHIATTGRPGPVVVDLPKNVMTSKAPFSYPESVHIRGYQANSAIPQRVLDRVKEKLESAARPVVLVGGGVISAGASEELSEWAMEAQIPIVSTLMGMGAFPSGNPLHLGMLGMHGTYAANKAVYRSDLLISLGVRFNDRVTGNTKAFSPDSYKIHINIDAAELNKNVPVDLPITGDILDFLREIKGHKPAEATKEWVQEVTAWKKTVPHFDRSSSTLKPQDVIRLIDERTQGDAIIATDVGQHQIWTAHHYAFQQPRSFITSGGLGTMGFGFPAAIGAAIADPSREVICISGDGSFQMNLQEMMTAVDYNLPIKIAILNNGYLGMVRQWQELFYDRRYSSVRINSPDFVAFARSCGAAGWRARNEEEAREIIDLAMNTSGPVILEFDVTEEENVFPMVPPGGSNHETMVSKKS